MNDNLIYLRGKMITKQEAEQYLTPRNRRGMLDWIAIEVCPKLVFPYQDLDIDTILKVVGKFRAAQRWKQDEPMRATINEYGHLFINGIHAGLITGKIPRGSFDEYEYYIEGQILARQEAGDY